MNAQIICALILFVLLTAILTRALWMKVETGDIPCTYKLFTVRDKLIRIVIEKGINRDDPYFDAMSQESSMSSVVQPRSPEVAASSFYRVAEELRDEKACKCQACMMWTIVFDSNGEETEIGQSWEGVLGKDAAQDVCDLMNMAYDAGLEATSEVKP